MLRNNSWSLGHYKYKLNMFTSKGSQSELAAILPGKLVLL